MGKTTYSEKLRDPRWQKKLQYHPEVFSEALAFMISQPEMQKKIVNHYLDNYPRTKKNFERRNLLKLNGETNEPNNT